MSDGIDMSSLSFLDQFRLCVDNVFATLTRTSKQDDELYVFAAGRGHRRDHPTFAVPDETNHLWIDLFALF